MNLALLLAQTLSQMLAFVPRDSHLAAGEYKTNPNFERVGWNGKEELMVLSPPPAYTLVHQAMPPFAALFKPEMQLEEDSERDWVTL